MTKWVARKNEANTGTFSFVRLLIGSKATEMIFSILKLGVIFGIIILIIGLLTNNVIKTIGIVVLVRRLRCLTYRIPKILTKVTIPMRNCFPPFYRALSG